LIINNSQWQLFFFSVNALRLLAHARKHLFTKRKGFNGEADEFGGLVKKDTKKMKKYKGALILLSSIFLLIAPGLVYGSDSEYIETHVKSISVDFFFEESGAIEVTLEKEEYITEKINSSYALGKFPLNLNEIDTGSIKIYRLSNPGKKFTKTSSLNQKDCDGKYALDYVNNVVYTCLDLREDETLDLELKFQYPPQNFSNQCREISGIMENNYSFSFPYLDDPYRLEFSLALEDNLTTDAPMTCPVRFSGPIQTRNGIKCYIQNFSLETQSKYFSENFTEGLNINKSINPVFSIDLDIKARLKNFEEEKLKQKQVKRDEFRNKFYGSIGFIGGILGSTAFLINFIPSYGGRFKNKVIDYVKKHNLEKKIFIVITIIFLCILILGISIQFDVFFSFFGM
jgi:hypothetical protein